MMEKNIFVMDRMLKKLPCNLPNIECLETGVQTESGLVD